MLERKTLSVRGGLLSYLSDSVGGKGTLLFLHGWRSEAAVWQRAMQALAEEGFAVYALDLPGFGGSQNPSHAFSVRDYAETVLAFVEKLGLGGVILIGHSFGGRIAIVFAAEHAKHVSKLVLVDAAGIRLPSIHREIIGFFAKITKPLFSLSFMQGARQMLYKSLGADDYLATPELTETFKLIINEDLQRLLPEISQETLLIWGEYDADTPISFATAMQKQIPHAELAIITDAKHFSFLDAPKKFIELLTNFLT